MEDEGQAPAPSVVVLLRRVAGVLLDERAARALCLGSLANMDSMTALRNAAHRGQAALLLAYSVSYE